MSYYKKRLSELCERMSKESVVVDPADINSSILNVPVGASATKQNLETEYRMAMMLYSASEVAGQKFVTCIAMSQLRNIKQIHMLKYGEPLDCDKIPPIDEKDIVELIQTNGWATVTVPPSDSALAVTSAVGEQQSRPSLTTAVSTNEEQECWPSRVKERRRTSTDSYSSTGTATADVAAEIEQQSAPPAARAVPTNQEPECRPSRRWIISFLF